MEKNEGKFTSFIKSIFMASEEPVIEEVVVELQPEDPTIEEVSEVVEQLAEVVAEEAKIEYMLKEDAEELIKDVVTQTIEHIKMAAAASKEAGDLANKAMATRVEKLELELQKPSKKAEKVIPPVKEVKAEHFSMAAEIKKNRN